MVPQKSRLSKVFLPQRCTEEHRDTRRNFDIPLCISVLLRASLCLSFFILSCQSPGNRLNTKAPKEAYNTTEMEVRNEHFLSTVHVPVSIALNDVERQINTQVNGLIYEDNSLTDNGNDQFMAKVWKRGTILVTAEDSLFHFTVPLKIWAKAGVSVLGFTQYKETEFEIDLRFKTKFDLDRDWSVNTQTQADGYGWVRRPTVSVVGGEYSDYKYC